MFIFDFDGVLIDSLDEVTLTAYNAETGSLFTLQDQMEPALTRLFKRNRFHVQPIGDALPLMSWCIANYKKVPEYLLSTEEYQDIIRSTDISLLARTNTFFNTRKNFVVKNKEAWLRLNKPFQPIWEALRRSINRFIILTNKNRNAVLDICSHFGLKIQAERIYTGDDGVTKIENMGQILHRYPDSSHYFIDDSFNNLCDLHEHFRLQEKTMRLCLAVWGYLGPNDAEEARKLQFPVLEQEDLISIFNHVVVMGDKVSITGRDLPSRNR